MLCWCLLDTRSSVIMLHCWGCCQGTQTLLKTDGLLQGQRKDGLPCRLPMLGNAVRFILATFPFPFFLPPPFLSFSFLWSCFVFFHWLQPPFKILNYFKILQSHGREALNVSHKVCWSFEVTHPIYRQRHLECREPKETLGSRCRLCPRSQEAGVRACEWCFTPWRALLKPVLLQFQMAAWLP